MNDADHEALQRLTVDELAPARCELVREYDRELRGSRANADRAAEIWAEADAISDVQRGRR